MKIAALARRSGDGAWRGRWLQAALGLLALVIVGAAVGSWLGLSGTERNDPRRAVGDEDIAVAASERAASERAASKRADPASRLAPRSPEAVRKRLDGGGVPSVPRLLRTGLRRDEAPEADNALEVARSPAAPDRLEPDDRETGDGTWGARESRAVRPLPAWRRYAAREDGIGTSPMIAIVIDDLGHSERHVVRALALDAPVTFSFLPYAPHARRLARKARAQGREVLMHLPMEPDNPTTDPGPNALRLDLDTAELKQRLEHNLAQLEDYVGVNNHMGSRFTRDAQAMAVVLAELDARGLMFLDSVTTASTVGFELAERRRMPYARRNVFLDSDAALGAVEDQLGLLEHMARERGYAVGIAHPYDETFAVLETWLPAARDRGLRIVPISAVAALECAC